MSTRARLGFAAISVTFACGGGGAQSPSASGGVCLPVAPMELLVLEHGREWEPIASLAADGTISQAVNKNPGVAFQITADVLRDSHGAPKMTCDASHTLHLEGTKLSMVFDGADALVGTGNDTSRIYVHDDGTVDVSLGRGTKPMPWKISGVTPATRRTAEILVLAAMSSAKWGG